MGQLLLIAGAVTAVLISWLWSFLFAFAVRPYLRAKRLRDQGVRGPINGSFWAGNMEEIQRMKMEARDMVLDINSHDHLARISPHFVRWASLYGRVFMYCVGRKPWLFVGDPELVKQVLSNKFGLYRKMEVGAGFTALLGKGLVLTEGEAWARHRRVVSPAFTIEKIKTMTRIMAECAQSMIENWREKEEVEVGVEFQELTADVISHTAFGSSYAAGKEVFSTQKELQTLIILASFSKFDLPISKYLPTEANRRRWGLEKKLRATLVSVIEKRMASSWSERQDLLGLMMEACVNGEDGKTKLSMDEIIDECKTFFFAGHETTSHLLTWTLFLLSTSQDWQRKLRQEVLLQCGRSIPHPDQLAKFKLMTAVLLEALRLYAPVGAIARTAREDAELGPSLTVPKGTDIIIPISVIHHSKEIWGPDAGEFNPGRFENGASKAASHPGAMLAFSTGPRGCVGQNFALMEAKTVLSMILQSFSFSLSPGYKHMPTERITLQPGEGMRVLLRPLEE
ncbi:Cytochrome P450 734A1 [Platanthera zijinensis]|uniref:Cytochrome P450 734A1 n=1 Tax=Platanthera zijinensis TaxID=2320716 RepID=A0AAP0FUF2_9ASPA